MPAAAEARERPARSATLVDEATMPDMPDGFQADAVNKHFGEDQ